MAEPSLSPQRPEDLADSEHPLANEPDNEVRNEEDPEAEQDVREKPVRERLEKTSITTAPTVLLDPSAAENASSEEASPITDPQHSDNDTTAQIPSLRGRKKRSFDEVNPGSPLDASAGATSKHFRKRSRDDQETGTESELATDAYATTTAYDANSDLVANANKPSARATTPPAGSTSAPVSSLEETTSPRNKRNRDQFTTDIDPNSDTSKAKEATSGDSAQSELAFSTNPSTESSTTKTDEPNTKRPRDESLTRANDAKSAASSQVQSSTGFANTSTKSPFGALASPKSPPLSSSQTSSSAFASSGFASFASSTQSPFGAVAATSTSSKPAVKDAGSTSEAQTKDAFASSGFGALSSTKSPFATATGTSAFGSQSAFGKLSNGFGSFGGGEKGFGAPLSSFASPIGSGITGLSSKPTKPIGASTDDADEEEDADQEDSENNQAIIAPTDENSQDSRFFEQEVETGEEDEETLFASRAKLYVSQDKQWKERGVGIFKVNASGKSGTKDANGEPAAKRSARLIMRADGSHRIVLNSPLKKEIKVEDPAGGPPKGKTAIFLGFVDEKPMMMQLKMRSNVQTEELHSVVRSLQSTL